MSTAFTGFRRKDGRIGVRNHLLILPTVVCANDVAARIQKKVPQAIVVPHPSGCCLIGKDAEQFTRCLAGLGSNPNIGGVLVVGLGCEQNDAHALAKLINRQGGTAKSVIIQEEGGATKTARRGTALARQLLRKLKAKKRTRASLTDLMLGTECGGSDYSSGLAANPVMGVASDALVDAGGTVILSETTELIGAEHILEKRATSKRVGKAILRIVRECEARALATGVDLRGTQPTPGNIEGGLTTIEEKSLGCIYKAGSAPIREVYAYGERVRKRGLVVMDTPGQDVDSMTGMVAGGAQVCTFSTGRGTPTGCAIAPVIKICANPVTTKTMREHVDFNAAPVLDGKLSLQKAGEKLFALLIEVTNGRLTCSEKLGHRELGITRIGPTF